MSRPHPFDYAFGDVAQSWFPDIRDDAAREGRDTASQGEFLKVPAVQRALGELTPEQAGAEGFLILLYSAYRFWEAGKITREAPRSALEPMLDRDSLDAPRPPDQACYVRIPEHWIWSRVHEQSPHEPVDGLFIVSGAGARDVLVVGVLGLRPDRGGYSEISASASRRDFAEAAAAAPPPRFAPAMEGGTTAGFRSVNSNAELLLLASLALASAGE